MGGAGPEGITYRWRPGCSATRPTPCSTRSSTRSRPATAAAVFGVVDKVIETGQDPRRFTEDLLRRLRDLVIVSAVPDAPATGLIDIAEDAAERLVAQAARFGPAELSRAADLVATGLTEMPAHRPRLLLELICARVLLPGADHSTEGVQARLDRLERRMTIAGGDRPLRARRRPAGARQRPAPPRPPGSARAGRAGRRRRPTPSGPPGRPAQPAPEARPAASPASVARGGAERGGPTRSSTGDPPPPAAPTTAARDRDGGRLAAEPGRRTPPLADIVKATKQRRRVTWIHLTQHAQVVAVDAQVLSLGSATSAPVSPSTTAAAPRSSGRPRSTWSATTGGSRPSSTRAPSPTAPHRRRARRRRAAGRDVGARRRR